MGDASVRVLDDDRADSVEPFGAFYRRAYGHALQLAWLLTGSRVGAEDVVHDAFARIFPRFDGLVVPDAYLRRSVVNGAENWRRDERRHRERSDLVAEPVEYEDGPARDLLAAVLALPYRQRVVIVARYWGGWSEVEIANALECRPGTVKSLSSRAIGSLRKAYSHDR
jgi:RNA polymerase sigma factor (sigma-70 family)